MLLLRLLLLRHQRLVPIGLLLQLLLLLLLRHELLLSLLQSPMCLFLQLLLLLLLRHELLLSLLLSPLLSPPAQPPGWVHRRLPPAAPLVAVPATAAAPPA